MADVCPSCGRPFEAPVRIRGGRCPECRRSSGLVEVGDRYGRLQFRTLPGLVEFDRVPPQPRGTFLGTVLIIVLVLLGALAGLALVPRPADAASQAVLGGCLLGGLVAMALTSFLLPLSYPSALVARRHALELGRWQRDGWNIYRNVRADRVQRLAVRETASGFGLVAQLRNGSELILASDLPEPDDASRLATAIREVLQIPADEPLQFGARVLAPERVDAPSAIRVVAIARGVRIRVPGLRALLLQADDVGLHVRRRFAHAVFIDVDDVQGLDAELFVPRPGGTPQYRVVARRRKGRVVVVPNLDTSQEAQFIRQELSRALGVEKS